MTRTYMRLLVLAFGGSCLLPMVTAVCSRLHQSGYSLLHGSFFAKTALFVAIALTLTRGFHLLLRRWGRALDLECAEHVKFLDNIAARYVDLAIFGTAALSLVLELAVIRWQATVFEFFAFYKNFGLLACFAGLGLGYALAGRARIALGLSIPILVWQFALLLALRFGMAPEHLESLRLLPFSEQLNMGVRSATSVEQVAIYFFLAVVFLLTLLACIPVGQICGRLMDRRGELRAYGWNLLGSLFGVGLMVLLSFLWTPPLVWFALCFGGILLFYSRKGVSLAAGVGFALAGLIVLAWPVNPLWQRIYSPYQSLEVGYGREGLMTLLVGGNYYQRVHNFSLSETDPGNKNISDYYEFPFSVHGKTAEVAIIGAGTGNDVEAALRAGAERVDAIEIDPAILMLGRNHPEKPYADPRVRTIVNDARSFLRSARGSYDIIDYGMLDSHTLLSQASNVRLDSFVSRSLTMP